MGQRGVIVLACVAVLAVMAAVGLLPTIGLNMLFPPPGEMYPKAPRMPVAVDDAPDDLLTRFEQILTDHAPTVLASLQPGLTNSQIDDLERKHGFKLTPDLRALYRWRNGTPREVQLDVFPNHRFVPLDEALAARDALRQQAEETSPLQRQFDATYVGHREPWLGLIEDMAGDGYFFDPERSEDEGSFFFCFAEDGSYVFYPAFRNFLAAVIEGHESGVFTFGSRGAETADFFQAQDLWDRYGASNIR